MSFLQLNYLLLYVLKIFLYLILSFFYFYLIFLKKNLIEQKGICFLQIVLVLLAWLYTRAFFYLLSFFEPFCYFLGESYGMRYISSTLGSIIIATIPIFTPFLVFIFHKKKISWLNVQVSLSLLLAF